VAPEPGKREPEPKGKTGAVLPNRGRLIVEAPADAKLFVDDHPIKLTAEKRSFSTPDLEKGATYYYEVRVEVVRDGKVVSETKKITFQAGEVARADFKAMESVATANAR
jgi:uncharacterized protein (TIGR03000 family)